MKKIKPYIQSKFNGINQSIDQTDIPEENCVDASNVNISIKGQISNILGMEKQIDSGLGGRVSMIFSDGKTNFALFSGTLGKL